MGREFAEQFFVIGRTNTREVAEAVKKVTDTQEPLKKVPNNPESEYPYTYYAYYTGSDERFIFGVSCFHRPAMGQNGADFKHWEPTQRYKITGSLAGLINEVILEKEVRKIHKGSFGYRFQRLKGESGILLTQAVATFPLL